MMRYRPDVAHWYRPDGKVESRPMMAEDSESGEYYHRDDVESLLKERDALRGAIEAHRKAVEPVTKNGPLYFDQRLWSVLEGEVKHE